MDGGGVGGLSKNLLSLGLNNIRELFYAYTFSDGYVAYQNKGSQNKKLITLSIKFRIFLLCLRQDLHNQPHVGLEFFKVWPEKGILLLQDPM